MKKQNFLTIAIFASVVLFAACSGGTGTKEVTLKTQEDSINYALGVYNGNGLKDSHFANDSSEKNVAAFMKALDEAYNAKTGDQVYQYGVQIGKMLKQQKKDGLEFDSTLTFKPELVLQGVLNGVKNFKEGMTPEDAQHYYQMTKQKRMEKNLPQPEIAPVPTTDTLATDSVK